MMVSTNSLTSSKKQGGPCGHQTGSLLVIRVERGRQNGSLPPIRSSDGPTNYWDTRPRRVGKLLHRSHRKPEPNETRAQTLLPSIISPDAGKPSTVVQRLLPPER